MQSAKAQRFFDVLTQVMHPGPLFPKPVRHGGNPFENAPDDGLTRQDTKALRSTCRAMAELIPPDNALSARKVAIKLKGMMTGGPSLLELGQNIMSEPWSRAYRDNVTPPNMLAEVKAMLRNRARKRIYGVDGNTERQNALVWLGFMTGTVGQIDSQAAADAWVHKLLEARGSNPERRHDFERLARSWAWESGVPLALSAWAIAAAWLLGPLPIYLGSINGQAVVAIGFEPEVSIPIPYAPACIVTGATGIVAYGSVRNLVKGLMASRDVWGPQIFRDRMLAELMLTHQTLSVHSIGGFELSDVQRRWDMRRIDMDPSSVLHDDLTTWADTVRR